MASYIIAGIVLVAAGGSLAVVLNAQGASCLAQLAEVDRSAFPSEALQDMERNCAIITNSYVYSLFAAVAGAVVLAVGYKKKKGQYP